MLLRRGRPAVWGSGSFIMRIRDAQRDYDVVADVLGVECGVVGSEE